MYDCGGLVRITICVAVCPLRPSISFPDGENEIARGVAIPAVATEPPPDGHFPAVPWRANREGWAYGAFGRKSDFHRGSSLGSGLRTSASVGVPGRITGPGIRAQRHF